MKCEYCGSILRPGETLHGIKYGTSDHYNDIFLPARDSAWIVICSTCGDQLCKKIYSKLASIDPSIYKTFSQIK